MKRITLGKCAKDVGKDFIDVHVELVQIVNLYSLCLLILYRIIVNYLLNRIYLKRLEEETVFSTNFVIFQFFTEI